MCVRLYAEWRCQASGAAVAVGGVVGVVAHSEQKLAQQHGNDGNGQRHGDVQRRHVRRMRQLRRLVRILECVGIPGGGCLAVVQAQTLDFLLQAVVLHAQLQRLAAQLLDLGGDLRLVDGRAAAVGGLKRGGGGNARGAKRIVSLWAIIEPQSFFFYFLSIICVLF